MIAFAHRPERWRRRPVQLTSRERRRAFEWLESLSAGGGTEMVSAIHNALEPLRSEAQRQVVIVTDGQIGFEGEAVRAIRDGLPAGSRLHAVGVGSASNRAFLHAAARAGRGVELAVGLDEDAAACAARIVAATQGPTLVDLEISGSAVEATAPRKPADLMLSAPVLHGVRLAPSGGELVVRGRTVEGAWERRIEVPATPCGAGSAAVVALFGRESVEDLELDLACGAERSSIDREIERIGLTFGLATRRTSWIAVAEEPSVDPREPVRFERVPQELPYGMSVAGLGLAEAAMPFPATFAAAETFGGIAPSRSLRVKHVADRDYRVARPTTFRGRVVPGPDGSSSIVEFVVDRPLDWRLPDEVTILTAAVHVTPPKARVLPSRSTRAGRIASGSIVRLELAVGVEILAESRIWVPLGSELIVIELAEES
jgi:Ca-activated chloride channel family protein